MKKKFIIFTTLLYSVFCILNTQARAAQLFFGTHSEEAGVQKAFEVGVFIDTQGQAINAVEGEIVFPAEALDILEVRDGGTIVSFWVERPAVATSTPGRVAFSGIVPGGYGGEKGYLFSLVATAAREGVVEIDADKLVLLLNDGSGSAAKVTTAPLQIKISPDSPVEEVLRPFDNIPPDDFLPVVSRDPGIFDGLWFVSFAAQDKGSGIDHYEILESRTYFDPAGADVKNMAWTVVQSPYVLKDQKLQSHIYIGAFDRDGNVRISLLFPKEQGISKMTIIAIFVIIIASLLALWFIRKIFRRR